MRNAFRPPAALKQLERALQDRDVKLAPETRAQTAVLDAVYRFPCGIVGVQLCKTWDELEQKWRAAQHELGTLTRAHRIAWGLGNDAYLLFLLDRAAVASVMTEERAALLRAIEASPSECLKEVVPLTEQWQQELDDLTFVPLRPPPRVPERASTAVAELLQDIGIPGDLAQDLTRRRGPTAERVVRGFGEGRYGDAPTVGRPSDAACPDKHKSDAILPDKRASSTEQVVHLKRLVLPNFRSYCGGPRDPVVVDLSAKLVLIYGENATGKTCLAQAIEWALCGNVGWLSSAVEHEGVTDCSGLPVRSIWAADRPAEVQLELSDGQTLSCLEGQDGTRAFGDSSLSEEDIVEELLGVGREAYERVEALRDRASANFILLQEQMSRLLSARLPDERLSQFATLLGESGLPRTESRLTDIGRELRRRLGQLGEEKTAVAEREEAALEERHRIADELASQTDEVACALTPDQYLERTRNYHAAAGTSIRDTSGQPLTDEATRAAVRRVALYLDERRASLVAAVDRARRREQCSKQLMSANAALAEAEQVVEQAKKGHEETAARTAELERELAHLDEQIGALHGDQQRSTGRRHAIERWFELKPLIQSRRERLSKLGKHVASLRSQVEGLDKDVSAKTAALGSARANLAAATRGRAEGRENVRKLQEVVDFLREHGRLDERLQRLDSERREAASSAIALQERLATATRRRDSMATAVSSTESRLRELRSRREARDHLLQSLREHVETDECPFCSHKYESREQLLAAVERTIGAPSAGERSLMTQLDQQRLSLQAAEQLVADCENQFEAARRRETEVVSEVHRTAALMDTLRGMLTAAGVPVNASVENVSAELERWQRTLEGAERGVSQAQHAATAQEQAFLEVTNRRRAAWDELGRTSREEQELTQQINQATSEARSALGVLAGADDELARELEQVRTEERSCTARLRDIDSDRSRVASDLASARQTLTRSEANVMLGEQKAGERRNAVAKLESDVRVLGPAEAAATIRTTEQELASVEQLVRDGQSVVHELDVRAVKGRLAAADRQLSALARQRQEIERATQRLAQWQRVLAETVGILQEKKARVVRLGLEPIGGFMRKIHRRLVRHPLFDEVEWTVGEKAIHFWASSRKGIIEGRRLVQAYTNQAHQNIVALSVFLAAALCRGGRLRTIVLDDPVQAMDEVNIYGLLDLLRQVSEQAQVILTTGRNDLFHLARAKFACLNDSEAQCFRAYRLKWGGPGIGTRLEEVT